MKTTKFTLKRDTIAGLNNHRADSIKAGAEITTPVKTTNDPTAATWCNICPNRFE